MDDLLLTCVSYFDDIERSRTYIGGLTLNPQTKSYTGTMRCQHGPGAQDIIAERGIQFLDEIITIEGCFVKDDFVMFERRPGTNESNRFYFLKPEFSGEGIRSSNYAGRWYYLSESVSISEKLEEIRECSKLQPSLFDVLAGMNWAAVKKGHVSDFRLHVGK